MKLIYSIIPKDEKIDYSLVNTGDFDLVELRLDGFEDLSLEKIEKVADRIKKPLLVSLRSKKEGGLADLDDMTYRELINQILQVLSFDFLDIQLNSYEDDKEGLYKILDLYGDRVFLSYHSKEDLSPGQIKELSEISEKCHLLKLVDSDDAPLRVIEKIKLADALKILYIAMGDNRFSRLMTAYYHPAYSFLSKDKSIGQFQIEDAEYLRREYEIGYYSKMSSPLGPIYIYSDQDSILDLSYSPKKDLEDGMVYVAYDSQVIRLAKDQLDEYFKGQRKNFSLKTKARQTDFQNKVYEELLKVGYGETVSYSGLAQRINRPRSARAVANALGKNRLPIIVPCHRVIRKDGSLGGYTGGIDKKVKLLEIEKRWKND